MYRIPQFGDDEFNHPIVIVKPVLCLVFGKELQVQFHPTVFIEDGKSAIFVPTYYVRNPAVRIVGVAVKAVWLKFDEITHTNTIADYSIISMRITDEPHYAEPGCFMRNKRRAIVINNVYPRPFGSDPFFSGQMPLAQRWHISILQLKQNIEYIAKYTPSIVLVGGDPRLHPEWSNAVELMHSFKDLDFIVRTPIDLTNFKMPVDQDNVRYWGEMICKRGRNDVPILIASMDVLPGQSKHYYWREARKYCDFWKYYPTPIYNNRVHYCIVAASMTKMIESEVISGWELTPDKDAFDHHDEEIEEQARECCHRCGCALFYKDPDIFPEQNIIDSAMASVTNLKQIKHNQRVRPYYPKAFI
jgi:hypothetical protein